MASYVRDRDLEHLTADNDPTAADARDVSTPPPPPPPGSRSSSISPQKKRRIQDSTNAKENESLLKRMGGPSAAKAGLGKDQEEVRVCSIASQHPKPSHPPNLVTDQQNHL